MLHRAAIGILAMLLGGALLAGCQTAPSPVSLTATASAVAALDNLATREASLIATANALATREAALLKTSSATVPDTDLGTAILGKWTLAERTDANGNKAASNDASELLQYDFRKDGTLLIAQSGANNTNQSAPTEAAYVVVDRNHLRVTVSERSVIWEATVEGDQLAIFYLRGTTRIGGVSMIRAD